MSTKWSTQVVGGNAKPDFGALLKDQYTVILLQGKNVFGDMIYCYVKITFPDLEKLQATLKTDNSFNPSDYGTVVAAGMGEPSPEVRSEVAITYPIMGGMSPTAAPGAAAVAASNIPTEKKAWDEY